MRNNAFLFQQLHQVVSPSDTSYQGEKLFSFILRGGDLRQWLSSKALSQADELETLHTLKRIIEKRLSQGGYRQNQVRLPCSIGQILKSCLDSGSRP